MSLATGTSVGPYRLERLLGRGGMAVVDEATHETAGRTVALKLVAPDLTDPSFLDRFREEGRLQAVLDHPHVVPVYEAGTSEYGPYLAMRLVRGTTLAGLIDDGALTSTRTLELLEQIAGALDAAHAAGLVHRDVKPRNVLVDDRDHAFLADFGLTRAEETPSATLTGQFMGTIAYAAPEVITGEPPGPAADRYALAAVLFECLTGTPVFPRPSHAAVLYAHTHEPPPRASRRQQGIPPALDDVLIAGLAKNPADRPRRAVDLISAARVALGGTELGPPAPRVLPASDDGTTASRAALPAASPPRVQAPGKGRRTIVAAAVAGVVVGGLAVALAIGGEAEAPAARPAQIRLPAPPAGTVRLGSDLSQPGRTVGCEGGPLGPTAPGCTIFQDRLAGATLIVQRNGVVRRWGVRSVVGEVALAVLRRRDDGYFQISRSSTEFLPDGRPAFFPADVAVERGDRLGLVVIDGSGVGVRAAADGASTARFVPAVAGPIQKEEPAMPGELLLRADVLEGARQRAPRQTVGAAAAQLPDGEVLLRKRGSYWGGRRFELRLVVVGGQGALDVFEKGRRRGRIVLDDLLPPLGSEPTIDTFQLPDHPHRIGLDLQFTRPESARVIRHFMDFGPDQFTVYN